ncbi:MAG: NmrA family NAD(P)-binding protein [Burkholderiaceae bacterium]
MTPITVLGASGNTGNRIARRLLEAGLHVRVFGRSKARLEALAALGAEVHIGEMTDSHDLARAFEGAGAVYALSPFDATRPGYRRQQELQGDALRDALAAAKVPHVVFLSSLGADQAEGTGVISSLHGVEQKLRTLGANVMFLRPGAFFETTLGMLPALKYEGVFGDAYAPDMAYPWVSTEDIAEVAAQALLERGWQGLVVREILGPRDLSNSDVARLVGAALGKPGLQYRQIPYADMAHLLGQAGLAPDFAEELVAFARGLNEGRIRSTQGRSAANSGGMTMEAFMPQVAAAYAAL